MATMNVRFLSEQSLEMVWNTVARCPLGEYLPSATKLSKTVQLSYLFIASAYDELQRRGYLEKRGPYFVKVMEGAFVPRYGR